MRAVSDEMVLTLSAAGTADDVAARIKFARGKGGMCSPSIDSAGDRGNVKMR
jgi:hypothetical protein